MKCKYCQAELESNSSVCPECGKDNLKDSLMPLKVVALTLTCLVMLVLLAGLVNFGVTGSFLPGWLTPDPKPSTGAPDSFEVITADGKVTMDNATLQQTMNQVVATMGSHELTNRELQLYYWMAVYTYGEDADLTKDLDSQIYDKETGKTYQDYCLEKALDAWQEVMLMADTARENKFELPKQYKDELEGMEADLQQYATYYGLSSVDELVQTQYGVGCNFATYYNYVADYYLGGLYWSEMVVELEVSEDQIIAYFEENADKLKEDTGIDKDFGDMVDMRNILLLVGSTEVEGEDGKKASTVTEENWADCQKEAQKVYDEWLAAGGTEEAFIALVSKYSKDNTSVKNEGLYEDQYRGCLSEVDVRHILIFPEGATSSTVTSKEWSEDAWSFAENKAKEILDEYLAGDRTEEAFGELAKKHSADGSASKGGLYEDVYVGQMVKNFQDWCFDSSRKPGDTGIVKTEYGYHVMFFVRADNEGDNWIFAEDRKPGDCTVVKTDKGYELLYFVDSEAAWYRYSRYGAQGEIAENMLEDLVKKNPCNLDESKVALTNMPK